MSVRICKLIILLSAAPGLAGNPTVPLVQPGAAAMHRLSPVDFFTRAWSTIQSCTLRVPPPLPLFPSQNSQLTDRHPRFDWSDAPGAVGYQFQLAADDSLKALLLS